MDDLKNLAHTIERKAKNTVKDIQSGDAAHILERKAKNTVHDVQEAAQSAGAAIKDAAGQAAPYLQKAGETIKTTAEDVAHKTGLDKVGETIKHTAEDVTHKAQEGLDRLMGKSGPDGPQ